MNRKVILIFFSTIMLLTCKTESEKTKAIASNEIEEHLVKPTKAESLLAETIKAHGGDLYTTAHYSFTFRGDIFEFKNDNNNYHYKKTSKKGNNITIDILNNGSHSRTVNKQTATLSQKKINSVTSAINSVIYFATLPSKLNDSAVNKTYIGETSIKGKNYYILGITFNKENGGEDHDDAFHYWINKNTKKIDYLAYNYKVNKGGVRFRSAYNTRVIDNITFQDYINYKAEVGTPLKELPALYEANKLKELSKIETENIINLNK